MRAAAQRLRQQLGRETIVDIDPKTGTPRVIARLDGVLSGPHTGDPTDIARGWIEDNAALLGLDDDDTDCLKAVGHDTSPAGITDMTFAQTYAGLRAFNTFIRVSVAHGGRVLNVTGSPTRNLYPNRTTPALTATEARGVAMRDAGASGRRAERRSRSHRGSAHHGFRRRPEGRARAVPQGSGHAAGVVSDDRPVPTCRLRLPRRRGRRDRPVAPEHRRRRDRPGMGFLPVQPRARRRWRAADPGFHANGWLSSTTTLSGPNAHTYADLNDNDVAATAEQIPPTGGRWNYPATFFNGAAPLLCNAQAPCVWNPFAASSWTTNERQNATQLFYYVNNFHDWLRGDPFGFTPASGNFEGVDAVEAQALDGSNGPGGLPDANHLDNANMSTPPDGRAPRMQMYLFTAANAGRVTAMNSGSRTTAAREPPLHRPAQGLGIHPLSERGRSRNVREDHRDDLPALVRHHRRRHRRSTRGAEPRLLAEAIATARARLTTRV